MNTLPSTGSFTQYFRDKAYRKKVEKKEQKRKRKEEKKREAKEFNKMKKRMKIRTEVGSRKLPEVNSVLDLENALALWTSPRKDQPTRTNQEELDRIKKELEDTKKRLLQLEKGKHVDLQAENGGSVLKTEQVNGEDNQHKKKKKKKQKTQEKNADTKVGESTENNKAKKKKRKRKSIEKEKRPHKKRKTES